MIISLVYEEYSPYLKGAIIKSNTINSILVNTRTVKRYPYSFSIPHIYPPTLQTPQVTTAWKLRFSFSFNPKWKQIPAPESLSCYEFNPDEYHNQKLTKVDWSYELDVRSCVNERFGDVIEVRSELDGQEIHLCIWEVTRLTLKSCMYWSCSIFVRMPTSLI